MSRQNIGIIPGRQYRNHLGHHLIRVAHLTPPVVGDTTEKVPRPCRDSATLKFGRVFTSDRQYVVGQEYSPERRAGETMR